MESFILYGEWERHFALLPPEQRGELISLIFAYANRGETPESKETGVAMAFSFIQAALDDNEEKYKKKQAARGVK